MFVGRLKRTTGARSVRQETLSKNPTGFSTVSGAGASRGMSQLWVLLQKSVRNDARCLGLQLRFLQLGHQLLGDVGAVGGIGFALGDLLHPAGADLVLGDPGIQAINGMVATVVLHVVFNLMANKKN